MGGREGKPNAPPRGSELLRLMLAGAVGGLPRSRVRDVSDAMLAVLLVTQGQGLQWLMDCINRMPDAVAAQGDKVPTAHASALMQPAWASPIRPSDPLRGRAAVQERFWQEVRQSVGVGMAGAGPRLLEVLPAWPRHV